MGILVSLCILRRTARKEGSVFLGGRYDLHRNLTLKLHKEKRSYPDERWLFVGRFKVRSVALEASKKVSKFMYDARPLIKSCNCY